VLPVLQLNPVFRSIEIGPDISAALAAAFADKTGLEIGQPYFHPATDRR
jgi:hypothetical protein